MVVSDDRLSVTKVSHDWFRDSALVEPAFDGAAGRAYAEWVLDRADAKCIVSLGVTALGDAAPRGPAAFSCAESRMFHCDGSPVTPAPPWSWRGCSRRCSQGDRVGLRVEGGRAWVYVNGERVGGGAMAEGLPPRLHFVAAAFREGARLRLVPGARPPEEG
jgi:hypothetical protein